MSPVNTTSPDVVGWRSVKPFFIGSTRYAPNVVWPESEFKSETLNRLVEAGVLVPVSRFEALDRRGGRRA